MQHRQDMQRLRAQGFRITRQRRIILDAVQRQGGHLSADDIFSAVQHEQPALDRATVYRTLHWLHRAGLVRKLDLGTDRQVFEYVTAEPHHHLICTECGTERAIDNHVIACLQAHIREHYDFDADPDHVAIFGRCAGCRVPPRPETETT